MSGKILLDEKQLSISSIVDLYIFIYNMGLMMMNHSILCDHSVGYLSVWEFNLYMMLS